MREKLDTLIPHIGHKGTGKNIKCLCVGGVTKREKYSCASHLFIQPFPPTTLPHAVSNTVYCNNKSC